MDFKWLNTRLFYIKEQWLLLFAFIFFSINSQAATQFEILGIKGKVFKNVQLRLSELYEEKSILKEPVETLRTQIIKAMYPFGYFNPSIKITTQAGKRHVYIQKGPQTHITQLTVKLIGEGAHNSNIQRAARDLPLKQGTPFLNHQYEEAKDMLTSSAEHEGYLHAGFKESKVLIDKQLNQVEITLIFNTGPQYYFGQVRFDPTYLSPKLLQRYVPFRLGEPYSTEDVLAFESNLSASGYFNSVVVKPNINSVRNVPIDVNVQPVNRINYSLGIGYGTDTGPRGRAGVHVVPVNRAGHKFNAIAQGSFNENAVLAQYLIPGKNPVTDKYSITGSLSNLNYNSGYGNSALLSLAQQHIKPRFQRTFSINALNERFNYSNEPKTTQSLLFPKATFTWSKVSDPLFSPSGYNITLSGLAAAQRFLSDINFAQASIDAKTALTVELIRTRFFFHTIQGVTETKNINQLPLSLALLLGGAEDLKAYSYNSIGPGKLLHYAGIELQKETFEKWYLIGFVDAGDVYQPTPRSYHYDAGGGLMWVSPIGPIKIGIAQAIDKRFRRIEGRNPKLVINMGPDL